MKKILLLLLLPIFTYSQNSWINIQLLTDQYPNETSWDITSQYNSLIIESDSVLLPYTLYDTTISVAGIIIAGVYDSFGDGLGGSMFGGVDGWFLIQNDCQDTIMYVTGNFGDSLVNTLTIAPCAPPTGGCTDSSAINFNPLASFDDSSCIYPLCSGLDTFYVETYCNLNGPVVSYNWITGTNPNCQVINYTRTKDINALGNTWYPYPSNWSNTGITYSFSDPNETYYFLAQLADSSYTDTLVITTGECITGCMDPLALNWHPWATIDDGSCQLPPANCSSGESNVLVTVIPDTYAGETSWTITDIYGSILASSPSYTITGVPILTETCIPNGTFINFNLYDSFGDGMCGTCYGGVDGTVLVQTLCGDTILSIIPGDANFGFDTTSTYTVTSCTPNNIPGCTDPNYVEYDIDATIDDGSCFTLTILGCTDPTSPDYDPLANTMSTISNCGYTLVITDGAEDGWFGAWLGIIQDTTIIGTYSMGPNDGANEIFTINLNTLSEIKVMFFAPGNSSSTAEQCGFYLINPLGDTLMSGGTNPWTDPMIQFPFRYDDLPYCGNYCTPGVLGCMDPTAFNYDSLANMPDNCIPIALGCTNSLAFNYDPLANTDDGSCIGVIIGCMDSTAFNFNPSANTNDPLSCIPVILGCMDDTQFNYNAAANTDDGSCIPIIFGCIDPLAFNYNSLANTNNGSCVPVVLGCTDPTAFNFNVNANTDDGSCVPVVLGCTDPTALNYDLSANVNIGCIYPILGCTDPNAFNFNINANVDDGSCIPYIYGCTDPTAYNFNPLANTNVGCIYPVYGCTDPNAFNYNPLANTDDNSCIPFIYGCMDVIAFNYNPAANTDNGSCVPVIYGCTDSTKFNYNPLANTDNATCVPFIYGCTDNTALNFDPIANTLNNSCCYIGGCTDPTAVNYNSDACFDDGSCVTPILGCTDVAAFNYDATANVSDTTACLYDAGCYGGPGIPYWLNNGCYAWVIDVDNYCCTNDWDANCQSMYNYCELGWPTSLENISSLGIIVYPNPVKDIITIDTRLNIEIELYNMTGMLILKEENINRIDVSNYPSGIYNMIITHDNKRFINKIIKQ